jgi:putative transposase
MQHVVLLGEPMPDSEVRARQLAMERYLRGENPAAICSSLGRGKCWFYKWMKRFRSGDENWFDELPRRPHGNSRKTANVVEQAVLKARDFLDTQGVFRGDQAIRWYLEEAGTESLPSLRTIGRILARHDRVDRATRYVPKGKKYPVLKAQLPRDVHQTDFVGPCFLKGPVRFYSLHSVDVATGRCMVQPMTQGKGGLIDAIWAGWLRLGLPRYEQVDNEWVFFGSPAHPRGMGNLIRLCLPLGIEPVFIPIREPWRNGVVEKFNHHWEQKFIRRETMSSAGELLAGSLRYEQRHNGRYRYTKLGGKTPAEALAATKAPLRFPQPQPPVQRPLPKPHEGRYHVVRLIRSDGQLDVFSERFKMPPETIYEYVWATVDVGRQRLSVRLDESTVEEIDYRLR